MSPNTKKILIETESHSVLLIHRNVGELHVAYCSECACDCEMLTLDGAVQLSGRRGREITRMVESGEVHSYETPNGYLLLCLRSLKTLVESNAHSIGDIGSAKKIVDLEELL